MWRRLGGLQVNKMCFTHALSSPSPTMSFYTMSFYHNEFSKFKDLPRPGDDDENSSSPNKATTHPVLLDLQMAHRLFNRPRTKGSFDKLKDDLQLSLQNRLKQLSQSKQTCEDVLEMADSAYVLMLLNSSNPKCEEAGRAIILFQEGVRLITHGQHLLKSAFPDL